MNFLKSEKELRCTEFHVRNLDKPAIRKRLKISTWIKTFHPKRDKKLKMTKEKNFKRVIDNSWFSLESALDYPLCKFFMKSFVFVT